MPTPLPSPWEANAAPTRRRRQWRRARVALAWGLALFAGLQLGLAVAIEYRLPELRDPFYANKAIRLYRRTTANPERPLCVVMLGSSRTAYGFRAGDLEEPLGRELGRPVVAYNFGVPAAGPVTQLLHLRRLLDDGVRPDLVLVEVLAPLLADQGAMPVEANWLSVSRLWLHDLALLERFGFPRKYLRRTWWQSWPVPVYAHRFAILSRLKAALLPYQLQQDWGIGQDDSGWSPQLVRPSSPEERRLAVERTRKEYARYFENFRLGGPTCAALHETLELCRQEGLPAAMVLLPEGSDFRGWYPPAAWAQIEAFVQGLSREYGAALVNAREWVGDECFSDGHHLLAEGAESFTGRLGREAVLPLLRRARTEP
jgi:hypothetical protein